MSETQCDNKIYGKDILNICENNSGNNMLVSGQMLVTDGTTGKVMSQAIPTVSVSHDGTGNVVKAVSNKDHAITYTMGYAVDTLEKATGSANSGVITNVTRTDNKLTVTYTDLTTNDPASNAATLAIIKPADVIAI